MPGMLLRLHRRPLRLALFDTTSFICEQLLWSAVTAAIGLAAGMVGAWRLSWGAFDVTSWAISLICAIAGPLILAAVVFCNYLFRAPRTRPETVAKVCLRFDGYRVFLVARNLSRPATFTATIQPENLPRWPADLQCTWLGESTGFALIPQTESRQALLGCLELKNDRGEQAAAGDVAIGKWVIPAHPASEQVSGGGFRIGDKVDRPAPAIDLSVALQAVPSIVGGRPIMKRVRLLGHQAFELDGDEVRPLAS